MLCRPPSFPTNYDALNAFVVDDVAACDPHSSSFLSADSLLVIADSYAHLTVCKDRLPGQCEVAKNMFSTEGSDRPLCAADVYSKLCSFSIAFPDILVCLQCALTLPIASATAERGFSVMRRIKSHVPACIYVRHKAEQPRTDSS